MQRNILLLFDDTAIKADVVHYAIVLAHRMSASIRMLMLLRLDFESDRVEGSDAMRISELNDSGEHAMVPWLKELDTEGIENSGIVRVGEPASEFIKFLAEGMDFNIVVWGGDKTIVGRRRLRLGEHWMAAIMDKLGCPMVAP